MSFRPWMEVLFQNSSAYRDFFQDIEEKENKAKNAMYHALLEGKEETARDYAHELKVYLDIKRSFNVEIAEFKQNQERNIK